ncbi:MAG: alanine--tRNA ligase, partial [Planctomycetia bacterium]
MKTDEFREAYLSFFQSKGCVRKPSDVLAPQDPSLLFTGAGMNQFKEQFLGIGKLEFTRATTCQKCIRTGDIENVGKTRFHMTFFEMLGNFSFGDYFKREAIHWAYEFVVGVMKIPVEKLRITVYKDDDEAFNIWTKEVKVPAGQLRRCGEDDNFWPASAPSQGPDGVCGPCSEIYVDLGGGREVEIWNLVFTQYNRVGDPPNNLHPLPKKNIDTGMGLERAVAVLQGAPTAFDIDVFKPIVAAASDLVGVAYRQDDPNAAKLRRIAEHVRTCTFLLHENVVPGPQKQGYVLRRLLRRALLDAYQFGAREPVLHKLTAAVVDSMKGGYPELVETAESVAGRIKIEEEQFLGVVDRGLDRMERYVKDLEGAGSSVIDGERAYDVVSTFGFPIELIEEMAATRNLTVDRDGYERARKQHSETSGGGGFAKEIFTVGPLQKLKDVLAPTEFVGYSRTECPAVVQAIIAENKLVTELVEIGHKDEITLVLDKSPFYGESGGQVGDVGFLTAPGFKFEVTDTLKKDGYFLHLGHVREGKATLGLKVSAVIDARRRAGIERAHSATHLLHAALHKVVGNHAKQAGSKVDDDVLRFDFSHNQAVTPDELRGIERWANERVMRAETVAAQVLPIAEAKKLGATALFGEKYGDEVRVVSMGDFSREFCGGCHLTNTGKVGFLKIVREEPVGSGVRRITAYTGLAALEYAQTQEGLMAQAAAAV